MLYYFHEIRSKSGLVYSLDNLRINFKVNPHRRDDFEKLFSAIARTDITSYPQNLSDFKFKFMWTISYPCDADKSIHKMTSGYIFNGSSGKSDVEKGYLDFNPNKLGSNRQFWLDFGYIKSCCYEWEIVRCDVAIDIPTKRECVYLEKDSRKYSLDAYSFENKTEYLGQRSHVGYVKLYNKSMESNLPLPLTRLEITCEPNLNSFKSAYPMVWDISQGGQFDTEILALNDTDLAIVRLCLASQQCHADPGMMIFNSIGRYKKQKLRKFVNPEHCLVSFDVSCIGSLFEDCFMLYT